MSQKRFGTSALLGSLLLFTGTAQAGQTQLVTDPFQNKVYSWNGKTLVNAQDVSDVIEVSPTEIQSSAAPLFWSANQVLIATQSGQILSFDRAEKSLVQLYASADACKQSAGFSGCIYSMTWVDLGKVYFLEHTRNDDDSLVELTPEGTRVLVTQIPGPSGPIWMKPSGHLGALPYGRGIYDFAVPAQSSKLGDLSHEVTPFETAGSVAAEGKTGEGKSVLVFHDYSELKSRTGDQVKNLVATSAVALDSCSGRAWFLNAENAVEAYSSEVYASDLPASAAQCPILTEWKLVARQGSEMNAARWDVVQGFPSGTARVPSTQVLSLGVRGSVTLESTREITATGGVDLRVFENVMKTNQGMFQEPAQVELSADGENWVSTGCSCAYPSAEACAGMQVTQSTPGNGVAPWSEKAGGLPINLSELGLTELKQIRITDCGKSTATPGGNPGIFAGFDLDAVVVTPAALGLKP